MYSKGKTDKDKPMSTPENKPLTPSTVLMSVVMLFSSVSGGVVVNSLGGGAAIDSKGVPTPGS